MGPNGPTLGPLKVKRGTVLFVVAKLYKYSRPETGNHFYISITPYLVMLKSEINHHGSRFRLGSAPKFN